MSHETKSLDNPDETRTFDNGKVDVVTLGGHSIGRGTLEKGWRWSSAVKPIVQTELCEVPHVGYVLAGTIHIIMADGDEFDITAGQAYSLDPGHDAYVVGDDTFRSIEFESLADYAKPV